MIYSLWFLLWHWSTAFPFLPPTLGAEIFLTGIIIPRCWIRHTSWRRLCHRDDPGSIKHRKEMKSLNVSNNCCRSQHHIAHVFGLPSQSYHCLSRSCALNHFAFGWMVSFLPAVIPSPYIYSPVYSGLPLSCSVLITSTPLFLICINFLQSPTCYYPFPIVLTVKGLFFIIILLGFPVWRESCVQLIAILSCVFS